MGLHTNRVEARWRANAERNRKRLAARGHDEAAHQRALHIQQIQGHIDEGVIESCRDAYGDERAEQMRATFEAKIAELRSEGPVGCGCGCTS